MASGDTLLTFHPFENAAPATIFATLDFMVGTSTPAERIPVLDFDDTTVEYADLYGIFPRNYGGGGVTVLIVWSAAEAVASGHKGIFSGAFRRIEDDGEDLDTTAFTYDYNTTGDIDPASAIGEVAYDTMTFTNGADMDSVAAGEYFCFRVKRPTPSGTKITGDISIHFIEIKET